LIGDGVGGLVKKGCAAVGKAADCGC
jgi:hypothetical protein